MLLTITKINEIMNGIVEAYIHAGGTVGVLVGFDVSDEAKTDDSGSLQWVRI